ncbi:sperm flagellar protein 2-like [Tenebrio molitor]|jgi:hypothetical protein|uniref:sperm flagellar protein 2-like n=1 Tax=Tenebrio molitor TaxID=7067 RepID=UPI003624763D
MIIGDYSLPWKTSVEIFGERYKEAMLEVGDHKITKKGKKGKKGKKKKKKGKGSKSEMKTSGKSSKKSKGKKSKGSKGKKTKGSKGKKSKGSKGKKSSKSSKSKKSGKSKKGKKGKNGKHKNEHEELGHEDEEIQVPSVEKVEEEELPEPRAGEPDWEYVNLPIPAEVELAIAILWDNFETNYVKNFKDLFFNKRVLLHDIVPFLAKTRDTMNDFIVLPDQKQYYLREFQKTLNDIDLELRNDPETKSELFCRIDEIKEKLLGICDTKMQESEEERRNFIRQNWLYHQFCQMTNNSAIAFQLEVDRLVDTLQFLSDYYIAVIIKSIKEGYEFHKVLLPKYECDDKQSEKFNNLFVEIDSVNDDRTEFHKYIEESKNVGLAFLDSMKPLALKPLNDMKKIFNPKAKEKKEKKKKKAKKTGSKGHMKKFGPDEDVKENAGRIFEEWQCAINGEIARMNVHLNIIRNEAFNRFDDVILWIKRIFEEIYDNISIRYENELASVHKACKLLLQSVEQVVIIHPELMFEGDQLAQIQVMLFPESLEVPEDPKEGAFKIEQIEFMVKVLFDLAHIGYIMRKTFLLLIQDILYQDDIEEETDTPKLWRNLSTSTLNALLKRLFDDEKYLYWKDFIVCNLMFPFPTREQLMEVTRQFREYDPLLTERVTREEYDTITFWFEEQEDVQLERLKSIIFKMYQTDENEFNWTAMLLDFCKDEDPVAGFTKALELSLGKFICYDDKTGRTFVSDILEDRILFERKPKEHEETVMIAKKAVSLLIDKIFDECEGSEGFALTEVVDQERTSFQSSRERERSMTSKGSEAYEQPEEGKIVTEHKFSYAKIGFEARDNTAVAYFLPLELVLVIVGTEMSWNLEIDNVEGGETFKDKIVEIYEGCRNEKFNDVVLSHEFLNCESLRALFKTTTKFSVHNPIKFVKRILYDKPDSALDPEEFVAMENELKDDGLENISETEKD